METNNPNEYHILPKWLVNSLGGLLVIFVAFLIVQQVYSFTNAVKNQKPANTITVSGDGQVTATPDLATITIGVMTKGSDAQTVKDQNNTKANQVIDFVKQQGVDSSDISTSQISIYPDQSYPEVMVPTNGPVSKMPTIVGYTGNQTITVKVHNVDKDVSVVNKIENGAVNAGANEVNGVYFSFSKDNLDSLQQKARQNAIDNAKQKAQGLAQQAGLNLGKVISISESNSGYPGPIPYALSAPAQGMGGVDKSVAPNIQNASQDITETMNVTFEVK